MAKSPTSSKPQPNRAAEADLGDFDSQFPARSKLETEYSPSSILPSLGTTLETEVNRYFAGSREAINHFSFAEHRYGQLPRNTILIVSQPTPPLAMLVYVHGGYWQELSVNESLFAASDAGLLGMGFAAIGYTLAPKASIEKIVVEVECALTYLQQQFPLTKLIVAGSSAGAHLVACVLQRGRNPIHQAILMSGIYDLRPLVDTYINDALGLTVDRATYLSPLLGRPPARDGATVTIVVGEHETDAFHEQSRSYAEHIETDAIVVPDRHHFDLPFDVITFVQPIN